MIRILALLAIILPSLAHAQALPSLQVRTPPANDNSARAASTSWVRTLDAPAFTGPFSAASQAIRVLPDSAAPLDIAVVSQEPQPIWRGRNFSVHTAPAGSPSAPRSYGYMGEQVTTTDLGAGINGPNTATYGRGTTVFKTGYPSATSPVGEMNAQLIYSRQSGPVPTTDEGASDQNGIQANIQQAGDPGFLASIEMNASRINPTPPYAMTHSIGIQIGTIDPFGKNGEAGLPRYSGVNRMTFGYLANANIGPLDRAFFAINSPTGSWEDFLYLGGGPNLFRVKGATGYPVLGSDGASVTLGRSASNQLTVQSTGGSAQPVQTVQGAWTNYTPTVTSAGGALGTRTSSGRYQVTGKRLDAILNVQWSAGGAGTGTGSLNVSLPPGVTTAGACVGAGRDNANGPMLQAFNINNTAINIVRYDNSAPIASAVALYVSLSCEIS